MTKSSRQILSSVVVICLLLPICVMIRPQGLAENNGISYFGVYRSTILPYAIAFLTCAFIYFQTARSLDQGVRHHGIIESLMKIISFSFIGLLLTPRSTMGLLHVMFAVLLFIAQFIISLLFLNAQKIDAVNVLLVTMMIVCALFITYFMAKPGGFLLHAQTVYQIAFGILLTRQLARPIEADGFPEHYIATNSRSVSQH